MSTGDWCKGETKETSERVRHMAENVSTKLRDPVLRKRLDEKKRLSITEIMQKIGASKTDWKIVSDFSSYTRQSDKNIACECFAGHRSLISLIDIINNVKCKVCHPHRNAGKLNPAHKDINVFFDRLMTKFKQDAFSFDPNEYDGLYSPLHLKCNTCHTTFIKAPRVLLNERIGCPACAAISRGNTQRRTQEQFIMAVDNRKDQCFIYTPHEGQTFGNADFVIRTCKTCGTTQEQCISNQTTVENGCSTCSQKKKHTTETFITKSKLIWGDMFDYSLANYTNNKEHVTLRCKKSGHVFSCSPSNHFSLKGCPDCAMKKFISAGEIEWLDSLAIPQGNRNVWINVNSQKFNVDALINGTIYEYYGDYWHGNPKRFDPERINVHAGITMQELYEHTTTREQTLRDAGYVMITMWESDWIKLRNTRPKFKL